VGGFDLTQEGEGSSLTASSEELEQQQIFEHVYKHVPGWSRCLKSFEDLEYKRLNGNSNACFKVSIKEDLHPEVSETRAVLYRRYEQQIIDKKIEQAIFGAMSENGTGPKMFFQNDVFRIEGFFEGRPITIWEMRNPVVSSSLAQQLCDFNFNPRAWLDVEKVES